MFISIKKTLLCLFFYNLVRPLKVANPFIMLYSIVVSALYKIQGNVVCKLVVGLWCLQVNNNF